MLASKDVKRRALQDLSRVLVTLGRSGLCAQILLPVGAAGVRQKADPSTCYWAAWRSGEAMFDLGRFEESMG